MQLIRYYVRKRLESGHIRAIRDVLTKTFSWEFSHSNYCLGYNGFMYLVDAVTEVDAIVKQHEQPKDLRIAFVSKGGRRLSLETRVGDHISLDADNKDEPPERILDALESTLGLRRLPYAAKQRPSSAFIAHVFDGEGQNSANELSRFLSLIGVRCQSGREFSPGRVSDKVRERLAAHDLFFAIVTPHHNHTWITQEISFAATLQKPLFILKHADVELNTGILGDHEYIPFETGIISRTFIQILEGIEAISKNEPDVQLWNYQGPSHFG